MNGAAAHGTEALASGPAPATDQPLQLTIRLGRQLEEAGVPYCHWKSNTAIDRSISGEATSAFSGGARPVRDIAPTSDAERQSLIAAERPRADCRQYFRNQRQHFARCGLAIPRT